MEPNFLAMRKFAKERMSKDRSGHGWDHVQRVVNVTRKLLTKLPQANAMVAETAAYLHDTIDDKLVSDPQLAQENLRRRLVNWRYSKDQIDEIMNIVTHMSFSANLGHHYHLSIEGQIVQDADRLDAIGAIGIARAMYYGGYVGEKLYDPNLKPRKQMTKAKERDYQHGTTINHFYEKLLKIKDGLNTPAAKELAKGRQKIMLRFLQDFKAEWNGDK